MLNKTERKLYPPKDCIYYHVELYTMRSRNGIILSYNTTESSKSPPAFEEVIRLPKLTAIYSKPKPKKIINALLYSFPSVDSIIFLNFNLQYIFF